jgi:uncharacterized lipoprotein YddW (UPF0748 family)
MKKIRVPRWLGRSLLFAVGLWAVLAIWQAPVVQQGAPTQELRGVWMTNYGSTLMYYTTRLDEAVANLAQHHINTLYPAVWNRGYTLHPSPVARKAGGGDRNPLLHVPLIPHQDVLAGLVTQARRQHLRLIPWFEYGLMISTNSAIAQQHPDWLTQTRSGDKILTPPTVQNDAPSAEKLQEFAGKNQAWLNPAHPAVQQFLTDLIVDVVQRYAVDGIQLDDHFSLPIQFGYDPYTIQLYRNDHNGTAPPQNSADPDWMAWRAAKITHLMGKISQAVKATRKGAIVSLSPNAPAFAYSTSLQNWPTWIQQGFVDEVVVQVYRKEITALQAELNSPSLLGLKSKIPLSIGLYTGPMLNAKPIQRLQQEAEAVQNAKYRGVSFFSWETTFWFFKRGSYNQVHQTFLKLFP